MREAISKAAHQYGVTEAEIVNTLVLLCARGACIAPRSLMAGPGEFKASVQGELYAAFH